MRKQDTNIGGGLSEKESSVLYPAKKDKHTTYRNSEKGRQRDYRRYKKRLSIRILIKQARLAQLVKELSNEPKI